MEVQIVWGVDEQLRDIVVLSDGVLRDQYFSFSFLITGR